MSLTYPPPLPSCHKATKRCDICDTVYVPNSHFPIITDATSLKNSPLPYHKQCKKGDDTKNGSSGESSHAEPCVLARMALVSQNAGVKRVAREVDGFCDTKYNMPHPKLSTQGPCRN